jgi:PAB1-binding protein PBP1
VTQATPVPPAPPPSSSLYELKLSYDIPRNIIEISKAKLKKVDSLNVQSVRDTSLKHHIIETKKRLKPTQINVHKKENRDIVSLCSLSNDVFLELLGSVSRIV